MTAEQIAERRPDEPINRLKDTAQGNGVLTQFDAKAVLEYLIRLETFIRSLP